MINGIDLATFNSAYDTYAAALKLSIAACMSNVAESNIVNLVVTAPANSKVRGQVASLAASSSISTSYQVSVHDPSQTYSSLSSQLSNAVSGGTFTVLLQSYGTSTGATGFQQASSDSVSTSDLVGSSGNDDDSLSGGAIAGIVIGVLVGVLLLAGIIYYFALSKPAAAAAQTNGQDTEVVMTNVTNPIGKNATANAV